MSTSSFGGSSLNQGERHHEKLWSIRCRHQFTFQRPDRIVSTARSALSHTHDRTQPKTAYHRRKTQIHLHRRRKSWAEQRPELLLVELNKIGSDGRNLLKCMYDSECDFFYLYKFTPQSTHLHCFLFLVIIWFTSD